MIFKIKQETLRSTLLFSRLIISGHHRILLHSRLDLQRSIVFKDQMLLLKLNTIETKFSVISTAKLNKCTQRKKALQLMLQLDIPSNPIQISITMHKMLAEFILDRAIMFLLHIMLLVVSLVRLLEHLVVSLAHQEV